MVNDENFDKQAKVAENVKMSATDASQTERRTKMERLKMDDNEVRTVYTLNTQMVETDGIEWAKDEFKDRLTIAERDGWGYVYCRLS